MAATKKAKKTNRKYAELSYAVDCHESGRDLLTFEEVQLMMKAASKGRHSTRDTAILRLMFQHAYRASELAQARLTRLNLHNAWILVERSKGSLSTE